MTITTQSKALVAQRFARSLPTYDRAAIVQRETAHQLLAMLRRSTAPIRFSRVLELGCGSGLLTDLLVEQLDIEHLMLNDLILNEVAPHLAPLKRRSQARYPAMRVDLCPGDMETIDLPAEQDLVISNAAIQWTNEPRIMLEKMIRALKPGGILAIGTFGPRNLQETRELTGSALHYLELNEILSILAPQAKALDTLEQMRTVRFPSALAVLRHLKRTGVNSLQRQRWSRTDVHDFCQRYETRFRDGAEVSLTYHPIIVVARRSRSVC